MMRGAPLPRGPLPMVRVGAPSSEHVSIVLPTYDSNGDPIKNDPDGVYGAPYVLADSPLRMKNVASPTAFSPKGHFWVAITTYSPPYAFHALDSNGYWFHGQSGVSSGALYDSDYPGADDRSWFDKAVDAVGSAIVNVGIPVLAAALVATGAGIAVDVAAGALLTWRGLAQGRSLSDSLIQAEKADLSKGPEELNAFQSGLDKVQAGLSTDELIQFAHASIPAGLDAAKKAFFTAVQVKRAQQTQNLTIAALKYYLKSTPAVNASHTGSDWDANTLDGAMQWGSDLGTVMLGLRGKAGVAMLQSLSDQAARIVQSLQKRPDLLQIIASNPDQADKHFSFKTTTAVATGSLSSSSSSILPIVGAGIGLGVVALLLL